MPRRFNISEWGNDSFKAIDRIFEESGYKLCKLSNIINPVIKANFEATLNQFPHSVPIIGEY